jgi:5-methyltetrahydropteroyltriglutamate--homocysteine methyltransferase
MKAEPHIEEKDFPEFFATRRFPASAGIKRYLCTGPIEYVGQAALRTDIANLKAALDGQPVTEAFMTAASPGVISLFQPNEYYPTIKDYQFALADAMREEYEAIAQAGFILQIDCPDLTGMMGAGGVPGQVPPDFATRVEALQRATKNIPAEQMRMHLCWGNSERPHHLDVPLKEVIGGAFGAGPQGVSFEGANPRHEHEWNVFQSVDLPQGKVIIPGVIDSTTNYIEHPELVAQRIERYVELVGPRNVMVGVDCGLATTATSSILDPRVAMAKLRSLTEGARLASEKLFATAAR